MNNIFVRRVDLDKSFQDMHKIKPSISVNLIGANKYTVRLQLAGKTAEITETLDKGLTKKVDVIHNKKTYCFDSVLNAERFVTELLK